MADPNQRSVSKSVLVDDVFYGVLGTKEGGMGRVWLLERAAGQAPDPIYRPRLAVKTFKQISDPESIERELNIWISLRHPAIVPLIKIGKLNYRLAAVMPMLAASLDSHLESVKLLDAKAAFGAVHQILKALHYAWTTYGVLHLDIKPSNILIASGEDFSVSVADWGISRLASQRLVEFVRGRDIDSDIHTTSYSAGTPLFMAPERFSGKWELKPCVDIFSVGMTAIYMLTGVLPFRLGELHPVEELLSGAYMANAQLLLNDQPSKLRKVLLNWLDPDPAVRPSSFDEARYQLQY